MDPDDAAKLYLKRIDMKIPHFETMKESNLNWIKMINAGERLEYNNRSFGYLANRIVFYLMNLHIKSRRTFFARAGTSDKTDYYQADAPLGDEGKVYAGKMATTLIEHREAERAALIAQGGSSAPLKPLTVWTSTRKRTVETADAFLEKGYTVRQRSQMSQLNPGVCEKLSEKAIRRLYPEEVEKHNSDPYHHRYPRAEVCHFEAKLVKILTAPSRTMTLQSVLSLSFLNWRESKMTSSSLLTNQSSVSCTVI